MRGLMYLIRHGATEANLARPARLQGRHQNPPLAALGIRQAELTRDFLAVRPIHECFTSPLLRARQTASIIAAPHGLTPRPLDELTECDVGSWEGLDWQSIHSADAEGYRRFMSNPAEFGYPGGETFADVHQRASRCLDDLLDQYIGLSIVVVAHHVVNRTYLAGLLGLGADRARGVALDNCGISVVIRDHDKTSIGTLNASFHLQGVAV